MKMRNSEVRNFCKQKESDWLCGLAKGRTEPVSKTEAVLKQMLKMSIFYKHLCSVKVDQYHKYKKPKHYICAVSKTEVG